MLDNINNVITSEQLLLNLEAARNSEPVKNQSVETEVAQKEVEKKSYVTSPIKAELSKSVLKQLNNYMSSEDVLADKLNTAQTIHDSLNSLRIELLSLKQKLYETPEENVEELENIDKESNSIIDKVVNVLKTDKYGIVDSKYLSNTFSQLSVIQNLSLDDNNYLTKIDSLGLNISKQANVYNKASDDLYSNLTDIYNKYEQSVGKTPVTEEDSKELQKKVVENFSETLLSTASSLTPEVVLGLLQGHN